MKTITYENALHKAAAYCSLSEKCPYDVLEKLRKWEVSNADAKKIIEHLKKEKFIDERRYCIAFVKDKSRFDKWGQQKIAYTLQAKHLPNEHIHEAIKMLNDADMFENLKEILSQKLRTIKYKDEQEKTAKLMRFAASRGFAPDLTYRALFGN